MFRFNSNKNLNSVEKTSRENTIDFRFMKDISDSIKQYQKQALRLSGITGVFNFTDYLDKNHYLLTAYTGYLNNINYTAFSNNISNFTNRNCNFLLNKIKDKAVLDYKIINPGKSEETYLFVDPDLVDSGVYDKDFNISTYIKDSIIRSLKDNKKDINYSGEIRNNVYPLRLFFIMRKIKEYLIENNIGKITCGYLGINTCECCKLDNSIVNDIMNEVIDQLNKNLFADTGIKCNYRIICKDVKTKCKKLDPIRITRCGIDGVVKCEKSACEFSKKDCKFSDDNCINNKKEYKQHIKDNIINKLKKINIV